MLQLCERPPQPFLVDGSRLPEIDPPVHHRIPEHQTLKIAPFGSAHHRQRPPETEPHQTDPGETGPPSHFRDGRRDVGQALGNLPLVIVAARIAASEIIEPQYRKAGLAETSRELPVGAVGVDVFVPQWGAEHHPAPPPGAGPWLMVGAVEGPVRPTEIEWHHSSINHTRFEYRGPDARACSRSSHAAASCPRVWNMSSPGLMRRPRCSSRPATTRIARSEWPPRSKKLSYRLTRSTPSTLDQMPATASSTALRGLSKDSSDSGLPWSGAGS